MPFCGAGGWPLPPPCNIGYSNVGTGAAPSGVLYLVLPDANGIYDTLSPAMSPGGSQSNSQCTVTFNSSTTSGNTLTVNVTVKFTAVLAGANDLWQYATTFEGGSGPWDWTGATWTVTTPTPDLGITARHTGSFYQGETGATYTLIVTNNGNQATTGTVTVADTVPAGLTATSIGGTGWSCPTQPSGPCTRSDALATGAPYPPITLTVNVAANAPASVTNSATVSGGGAPNNTATDLTVVNAVPTPDLTIAKTHVGNFVPGGTGAYTIVVSNVGTGLTSGAVTVTELLPAGMIGTGMSGNNWTCTQPSGPCSRSDSLVAGSSYDPITLAVNVASSIPASVTNVATVSGGGEVFTGNDTASDVTATPDPPTIGTISLAPSGNVTQTLTAAFNDNLGGSDISDAQVVIAADSGPGGGPAPPNCNIGYSNGALYLVIPDANGNYDALSTALMPGPSQAPIANSQCAVSNFSYNPTSTQLTVTATIAFRAAFAGNKRFWGWAKDLQNVSGSADWVTSTDDSWTGSVPAAPELSITSSHNPGIFILGQTGTYTLTVTNTGTAPTTGDLVTVTDTLPAGLTATAMSGPGWSCTTGTLTCTRSDARSPLNSYDQITLTVSVANNVPASVTNQAAVSGGGVAALVTASSPTASVTDQTLTGGAGCVSGWALYTSSGTWTVPANCTQATMEAWGAGGGGENGNSGMMNFSGGGGGGGAYSTVAILVSSGQSYSVTVGAGGGSGGAGGPSYVQLSGVDQVRAAGGNGAGGFYCASPGSGGSGGVGALYAGGAGSCAYNSGGGGGGGAMASANGTPASGQTGGIFGGGNGGSNASGSAGSSPGGGGGGGSGNIFAAYGGGSGGNGQVKITWSAGPGPVWTMSESDSGNFIKGLTGATYTIQVSNVGAGPSTSGTQVAVTAALSAGLTATAISGSNWNCLLTNLSCSRSDALVAGGSYPPIVLTVNVGSTAPATASSQASVTVGSGNPITFTDTTAVQQQVASPAFSLASGNYPTTQSVTLTAATGASIRYGTSTDGATWLWQTWTPDPQHPQNLCQITVTGTMTIQAIAFMAGWADSAPNSATYVIWFLLTTAVNPPGTGTITVSPSAASYAAGTVVTVSASPSAGYQFTGFSGGLGGTNTPQNLTISAPVSVTANFASSRPSYSLSISAAKPGTDSVTCAASTATYSINIVSASGFNGPVTLYYDGMFYTAASGTPATNEDNSAVISPTAISSADTATLYIYNQVHTPCIPWPYVVKIHDSNGQTATAALNVGSAPDFRIAATAPSQPTAPGASATYTVTISPLNGFSGPVTLSCSGSGITCPSQSPINVSGTTNASLTVNTTADSFSETFTITATGAPSTQTIVAVLSVSSNLMDIAVLYLFADRQQLLVATGGPAANEALIGLSSSELNTVNSETSSADQQLAQLDPSAGNYVSSQRSILQTMSNHIQSNLSAASWQIVNNHIQNQLRPSLTRSAESQSGDCTSTAVTCALMRADISFFNAGATNLGLGGWVESYVVGQDAPSYSAIVQNFTATFTPPGGSPTVIAARSYDSKSNGAIARLGMPPIASPVPGTYTVQAQHGFTGPVNMPPFQSAYQATPPTPPAQATFDPSNGIHKYWTPVDFALQVGTDTTHIYKSGTVTVPCTPPGVIVTAIFIPGWEGSAPPVSWLGGTTLYNNPTGIYRQVQCGATVTASVGANLAATITVQAQASIITTPPPAKIVIGSGGQVSMTVAGSPSDGASYSWQVLATQTGDDTTVLATDPSTLPSCSNQATCTVTLTAAGDHGGKATLRLSFTSTATGQTAMADARVIVVKINSVVAGIKNNLDSNTLTKSYSIAVPQGDLQWPDSLWAATSPPLIVIQGTVPSISLDVSSTPSATDPDVFGTIVFQPVRARDDSVALGSGVPSQTGSPGHTDLNLDQYGSFQVLAFVDSNGNGQRDSNETGIAVPLVIVTVSSVVNKSAANRTVQYSQVALTSGNYAKIWNPSASAEPNTNELFLDAFVNFVGGGPNGRRGVCLPNSLPDSAGNTCADQVFGAWVQNETAPVQSEPANESTIGLYQDGHQTYMMFVSDPGDSTGPPLGDCPDCYPTFGLGGHPFVPLNLPLVDTGHMYSTPGTGGNSSAMSGPVPFANADPLVGLGRQEEIRAVDNTSDLFFDRHPAYPSSELTSAQVGLTFTTYLTVWVNVSATPGATGDWADHVYGVLLTQPWTLNTTYQVDASYNGTAVGTTTVSLGIATQNLLPVPLPKTVLMNPPTVTNSVAVNAQQ